MRGRLVTSLMALALVVPALAAQPSAAIDVSNAVGRQGAEPWLRETRLAPELRATSRAAYLRMNGLVVERAGNLSLRDAAIDGVVSSPAFAEGLLRASLANTVTYRADGIASNVATDVSASMSARLRASGIWLGAVHNSAHTLSGESYGMTAGVWHVLGGAVLSVTSSALRQPLSLQQVGSRSVTYRDSVYSDTSGWSYFNRSRTVTDSNRAGRLRPSFETEARVDWSFSRVSLVALLSRRTVVDSVPARSLTWGGVTAIVRLRPHLSLVAAGGTMPPAGARVSSATFASLGVRFSPALLLRSPPPHAVRPAATAFTLRALGDGTYRLALRVPSARTVEISGDFNRWQPLALTETSPNVWEATLAITAGTHRVNVRVDGDRWIAPPGLPVVDDEFNGRVGLLVIP